MSWNPTCEALLKSYPAFDSICISDHGGNVYGTTPGFDVQQAELLSALNVLTKGTLGSTSFLLNKEKYFILRTMDNMILASHGKKHLIFSKIKTLLLVGLCIDTDMELMSGKGLEQMYKMSDYYTTLNY